MSATEVESLRTQLATLEVESVQARQQLGDRASEVESLRALLAASTEALSQTKTESEALRASAMSSSGELQAEIKAQAAQMEVMEAELSRGRASLAHCELELAALQVRMRFNKREVFMCLT